MPESGFSQQITFLHSSDLETTLQFYSDVLGLNLVRDQGICLIFQVTETAFLGFCEHIVPIQPGRRIILTLVSDEVDHWYEILKGKKVDLAAPPKLNPQYQIYHFFLKDPDGYTIEIQKFVNPL